ncbi:hypothetical protein [Roseovarius sp.]|jgi:hypothetical protein
MGPKIATCNYCGTRAALVLDQGRHELSCSACGAPLHDMKFMPQQDDGRKKIGRPTGAGMASARRKVQVDWDEERRLALGERARRKPVKRRKSLGRKVLSEIWDVVEDIFD